jgi:hypothetical protein
MKQAWKADREKARAEVERAKALEQQLADARQNAWTPEQKADYEHASTVRRRFDFISDPEFQQRFHVPVRQQLDDLRRDRQALPDSRPPQPG